MRSPLDKYLGAHALCAALRHKSAQTCCAVLTTFLIVFVPTARASLIQFDPDGNFNPNGTAGSDPVATTGSFNFLSGNILMQGLGDITQPNAAQAITYYLQTRVGTLRDANSNPITNNHLNQNYEITLVMGDSALVNKTATGGTLSSAGTGTNFFKLFYGSPANSIALSGTGYDDGNLILAGTVSSLTGTYLTLAGTQTYDEFSNAYPNKLTRTIIGGVSVNVGNFTTVNSNFFQVAPATLSLSLTTGSLVTPFNTVDPAQSFSNGAGGLIASNAFAATGANSNINGANTDFQVQIDSSASFNLVPEPSSSLLGGLGLIGLLAVARRKQLSAPLKSGVSSAVPESPYFKQQTESLR